VVMLVLAAIVVGGCTTFGFGGLMGHRAPGGITSMMGPGQATAGPGEPGFVAGTPGAPRVVSILAGPRSNFTPTDVAIVAGETITFTVTGMGPSAHEFKVGPLDVVVADGDAPEIADISMMETKSLTYTFAGPGPFAYACHEPGHFEAGMRGAITVLP
jgi:plastocyanin